MKRWIRSNLISLSFVHKLDVAISYSSTATKDVRYVLDTFEARLNLYDYTDRLPDQIGETVDRVARAIYSDFPTIVFATKDWFQRPATVREMEILRENAQPKLVFDYVGKFAQEACGHQITNWVSGPFDDHERPSLIAVNSFLMSVYPRHFRGG